MNNLKCRKQGFNKWVCKITNKEIQLCNCNNCPFKEYKTSTSSLRNSAEIKKRTYKLSKLERSRFSLFTDNLDYCIICGNKKDNLHEVFFGRNRQLSMKYGLVIPLCTKCHLEMHKNSKLQHVWYRKGQVIFNKTYPDLKFEDIFRKNYL